VLASLVAACSQPSSDAETAARPTSTPASAGTAPVAPLPEPSTNVPSTNVPSTSGRTSDQPSASVPSASGPVPSDAPAASGSVVARFAGASWFLGTVPATPTPADVALPPVKLGIINQEDNPIGSYPEIRVAVEAAAAWVNAELGGVHGHPIEIVSCITPFDAERSRTCALELIEQEVVAFVGGVDVMSSGSFPVIEERGLVSIGGIPANLVEQRSPNAYFFSGGDSGALAGFMAHAASGGATKVTIMFGAEVESFEVAARDYGAAVGTRLGLDVELLPYSIFTTDVEPLLASVQEGGAEALMVLAATEACVPVMRTAAELELDAQLYLTGACAEADTIAAAGEAVEGVVFNAEGPLDGTDVEALLYLAATERYADAAAGGAGTIGFRGFMNLYALLLETGPTATSETLARAARAAIDRPSFWGHPYTCDGAQVPGLPALCAPQQILFEVAEVGAPFTPVTDWIPTDELFTAALG
jgi:branched-chain amino acid transport system substrate-binding protein